MSHGHMPNQANTLKTNKKKIITEYLTFLAQIHQNLLQCSMLHLVNVSLHVCSDHHFSFVTNV